MNKIEKKVNPEFFNFEEGIDSTSDYRGRGSTFYETQIIEINEKTHPGSKTDFHGFRQTNEIINDTEYGTDDEYYELNRVKKKVVETYTWERV